MEVEGEGPIVICSPCMGDFHDAFAPLKAHFVGRGCRVALVDLRGHGDSTTGFERYGTRRPRMVCWRKLTLPAESPRCWRASRRRWRRSSSRRGRRPEKVSGLVLFGPYLRNDGGKTMRGLLHVALTGPWGPSVWRVYAAKLWPGLGKQVSERAAKSAASLTRPGRWAAFHASRPSTMKSSRRGSVGSAPVLVVMRDADPDWNDPVAGAAWVASDFADAEVITVPGLGHAPMLERPAVVDPAVAKFLERIAPGDAPSGRR